MDLMMALNELELKRGVGDEGNGDTREEMLEYVESGYSRNTNDEDGIENGIRIEDESRDSDYSTDTDSNKISNLTKTTSSSIRSPKHFRYPTSSRRRIFRFPVVKKVAILSIDCFGNDIVRENSVVMGRFKRF